VVILLYRGKECLRTNSAWRSAAGSNLRQHRIHERPQAVAKDDDRNPATFEVLLKTDVFVGCEQQVKPSLFRDTQ